jgi:hypothetical protein
MPKTLGCFRPCQIWMRSKTLAKALSSLFWHCSALSLPALHFTPFSTSTLSTSCWLCNSELSIFARIVLSACIDHMPCNSKVHMLFLTLPDSPLYFLGALLIFLAQELNHLFWIVHCQPSHPFQLLALSTSQFALLQVLGSLFLSSEFCYTQNVAHKSHLNVHCTLVEFTL